MTEDCKSTLPRINGKLLTGLGPTCYPRRLRDRHRMQRGTPSEKDGISKRTSSPRIQALTGLCGSSNRDRPSDDSVKPASPRLMVIEYMVAKLIRFFGSSRRQSSSSLSSPASWSPLCLHRTTGETGTKLMASSGVRGSNSLKQVSAQCFWSKRS